MNKFLEYKLFSKQNIFPKQNSRIKKYLPKTKFKNKIYILEIKFLQNKKHFIKKMWISCYKQLNLLPYKNLFADGV